MCICLHGHVQHTCTCTCVLYCKQLPRECCSEHCSYAYHYDNNCLNKTFTLLVHVYTIHIPMKFAFFHRLSLHMTCVCVCVSLASFPFERGGERGLETTVCVCVAWEQGCSMPLHIYDVCTMYMYVVGILPRPFNSLVPRLSLLPRNKYAYDL